MRRLFTAFVSSTFLDLRVERQRLVAVLLDQGCVPLGMEFFPSAGQTQWPLIVDSIQAADFCIFVVAGRYGSISDTGLSWTHREFHEALRQGKPIAVIVHGDPESLPQDRREDDPQRLERLAAFREEILGATFARFFTNEADLVQAVTASITKLRESPDVRGWLRADPDRIVVQESDFDRIYELVETEWNYVESAEPGTWDGIYRGRRRMRANDPNGLHRVAHDFTRDTDSQLPFTETRFPQLTLVKCERSGSGTAALAPPRKRTGSTFVQDIVFNPPLSVGEVVDWELEARCPEFKYASRERLLAATVDSRLGARVYDWAARRVAYPTRHLRMTIYLPLRLGAEPRGPLLGRGSSYIDHELSAEVARDGSYSYAQVEHRSVQCHRLSLEMDDPPLFRYYRLAWNLP